MWLKWGINIRVLRGCLAIGEDLSNDRWCFHIWVMKNYGVQASWTKAYNIESTVRKLRCFEHISQILGLCHNGDILLLLKNKNLVSFNSVDLRLKFHMIEKLFSFQAFHYIPNFSSLTDIAKGEPLFNATSR